ncbi:MAG: hypothetical protein ABI812_05875 [Betaproteobacteria bacterium]
MSALPRRFLNAARAVALSALLPLGAHAADYTDLWFVPSESGWGVNVVQSDNFMFLTFFIYGADNKPTWLTAQLTLDAQGAYSGGLYATSGTYYAKPWNTGDAIPAQQVGSAQFKPGAANSAQATLTYVVNGVGTVIKAIERQSLTAINIAGAYVGGLAGVQSGCSNSGSYKPTYDLAVAQTAAGIATLTFTFPTYACTLKGTLVPTGRQYRIDQAEYRCAQGNTTVVSAKANVSELKATAQGIEGRWVAPVNGGCTETAYFSAVLL